MTKEQQQVRDFFGLAKQNFNPGPPSWPKFPDVLFVWETLNEELGELRNAMSDEDIVEYTDALCDLMYFIYGAALRFGIDLEPCFQEVHRSNMTKVWPPGTPKEQMYSKNRKYLKPPGYSRCNLKKVLEAQGAKIDG